MQAASVARILTPLDLPTVQLGHLDAILTIGVAIALGDPRIRRNRGLLQRLAIVLLASTIVTHSGTLVPEHLGRALVGVGVILPALWVLVLHGRELNALIRTDKVEVVVLVLGQFALIVFLTLVQLRIGDFYGGREENSFVDLAGSAGDVARLQLVFPLLLILLASDWVWARNTGSRQTVET
jgi:hypothetical protein